MAGGSGIFSFVMDVMLMLLANFLFFSIKVWSSSMSAGASFQLWEGWFGARGKESNPYPPGSDYS